MADHFSHDVFLNYSSKDQEIVRPVAERLKDAGLKVWFDQWELKPGDDIEAKIEDGLANSRVQVLCTSANALGSDWAELESYTLRFRDPLNKESRFITFRLDDIPVKESLAQFLWIDLSQDLETAYAALVEACADSMTSPQVNSLPEQFKIAAFSLGHTESVCSVALSNDGRYVLSGSADKTMRLWEVSSGRCVRVFEGHSANVLSVAWSGDGAHALTGSADKTLRLWEMSSGRCVRVFEGHGASVWSVALSRDGAHALTGSVDKTVRLWEVGSGRCVRVFEGHSDRVSSVALSSDGQYVLSGDESTVRLWEVSSGRCVRVFEGHSSGVWSVAWSGDGAHALTGSGDRTVRLWEVSSGRCVRVFEGHSANVLSVAWSSDGKYVLSGGDDSTVRLWEVSSGRCVRVFEGHSDRVLSVVLSNDGRYLLSGSYDKTMRLWEVSNGRCVRVFEGHSDRIWSVAWSGDAQHAFSAAANGVLRVWDSDLSNERVAFRLVQAEERPAFNRDVQYTNAKVLVVGDTSAGKTALTHRLATGTWQPSDGSTVGAWSTQWPLPDVERTEDLEHEIWLWDFGGQADQRLVHQLYMDRAALILLLFDADKEDVLPGMREWQTALRRCVSPQTPLFLVAGRVDAGFKASRARIQSFAQEQGLSYFETSAKEGTNCESLSRAITERIPWDRMEKRTSPRIFKLIKDEILKLRDEGEVLFAFKELREVLRQRLPSEARFADDILKTVVGLLDGPGVVKELDYGTYILLQPEWINTYAQAVIRTLRQDPKELGALPLRSIEEGKLLFQTVGRDGGIVNMKRLAEAEERVVLREMERQLEERGLCLRQGDKLVFPSHCGRERPEKLEYPSVFISHAVKGYLDNIYATLVVKLADCESFRLKELWRGAADFETLKGDEHMGVKLTRASEDSGDISVYFGPSVRIQEKVIFANYIHAHLRNRSEKVQRLRHYVCPHCNTPKGNPQVLMKKLLEKKKEATVECDSCEQRFDLWDDLEILFASDEVRKQVEELRETDAIRLDTRRRGKLLALEVSARITSADQKCFEIPATEDEGIDMHLEFTDDEGKGTGNYVYLQLKSGNSHLRKRKNGTEIFPIKEQRWVDYWMKQPHPVILVIGTFAEDDERGARRSKLEFEDVRWMEISDYLKRESQNGTKPVKQIEFKGERLDLTSVRRLRDKVLGRLPQRR
jgi:small GTP-binding protein